MIIFGTHEAYITLFFVLKRRLKESKRLVPPPGVGWLRVDREKNKYGKPFRDKGELAEEKAGLGDHPARRGG